MIILIKHYRQRDEFKNIYAYNSCIKCHRVFKTKDEKTCQKCNKINDQPISDFKFEIIIRSQEELHNFVGFRRFLNQNDYKIDTSGDIEMELNSRNNGKGITIDFMKQMASMIVDDNDMEKRTESNIILAMNY